MTFNFVTTDNPGTAPESYTSVYDGNTSTKWYTATNSSFLQWTDTYGVMTSYSITSASDAPERDPYNWTMKGSNDGTNFVTLDTQTAQTFSSRLLTITFTVTGAGTYSQYRWDWSSNSATQQVAELSVAIDPAAFSDLFSAAQLVSLPSTFDNSLWTTEAGEPLGNGPSTYTGWSKLTVAANGGYSLSLTGAATQVAVYTGTSFADLVNVLPVSGAYSLTVGTVYYVQVGNTGAEAGGSSTLTQVQISSAGAVAGLTSISSAQTRASKLFKGRSTALLDDGSVA